MVWRRVYVPVKTGSELAGYAVSHRQYEESLQYQRLLRDNEDSGWEGAFTTTLSCILEADGNSSPSLELEATAESINIIEQTHDGPMPVRLYNSLEENEVVFSDMVLFYAFDTMPDTFDVEGVAEQLDDKGARLWRRTVETARDDDQFSS